MKDNFWGRIWSSFREVQNFWYGFFGIVLAILFSVVSGKLTIPLYVVVILITVFILIISTLFNAYELTHKDYLRFRHPAILRVVKENKNKTIICLIEYSEVFAIDSRVSFYYTDENGFESLIAIGYVKNVQRDGNVQVEVDYPEPTYQDILARLENNDSQVLAKTFIKPGVTRDF
ncbi:hypothetical protein [Synechocystis sp. LKSZ1]|uniref:hypothetical protein n=1 Tax=Synechocystis sp. LKSZ1 TaxID=3144951 RepID=UPI00336C2CCB